MDPNGRAVWNLPLNGVIPCFRGDHWPAWLNGLREPLGPENVKAEVSWNRRAVAPFQTPGKSAAG